MPTNQRQKLRKQLSETRAQYWYMSTTNEIFYLQRKVKQIKKRLVIVETKYITKRDQSEPKYDQDIVLEQNVRQSHNKGFKNDWRPTRDRYWKSNNNNWKQRHRVRKQWMKNI